MTFWFLVFGFVLYCFFLLLLLLVWFGFGFFCFFAFLFMFSSLWHYALVSLFLSESGQHLPNTHTTYACMRVHTHTPFLARCFHYVEPVVYLRISSVCCCLRPTPLLSWSPAAQSVKASSCSLPPLCCSGRLSATSVVTSLIQLFQTSLKCLDLTVHLKNMPSCPHITIGVEHKNNKQNPFYWASGPCLSSLSEPPVPLS